MTKAPVMMANVCAALRSRFASSNWRRLASFWCGLAMLANTPRPTVVPMGLVAPVPAPPSPAPVGLPPMAMDCASGVMAFKWDAIRCCCAALATCCESVMISLALLVRYWENESETARERERERKSEALKDKDKKVHTQSKQKQLASFCWNNWAVGAVVAVAAGEQLHNWAEHSTQVTN